MHPKNIEDSTVYKAAGAVGASVLYLVSTRLMRVDYKLAKIDARWNLLDWRGDALVRERRRQHLLSSKNAVYDMIVLHVKLFGLVTLLFLVSLWQGCVAAVARVLMGICLFTADFFLDQYFPPDPGALLDANALQTSLDAGVLVSYSLSLCATLAVAAESEEVLKSAWWLAAPLVALPACAVSYSFRAEDGALRRALRGGVHQYRTLGRQHREEALLDAAAP